ncbi:hypothetical protein LTR47_011226 [Exophiala xenobiotica]|nr:hypothetical protein LTR41_011125 [Exophiala xenobiotica]KAK5220329.1 hypothetical protein LTR47_011226 [Exophiala xenobiotica]KAK5285406.1 hypothetical protein LTR14_010990 [Exophiala xenobiotica]KAK5345227.1 hypothetical protein LTR61_010989 [Exophiala xenobiotica]
MNEEFGVLKDMIAACEGVEMHRLAILQAGIEYVRYLESCVAQPKTENEKQKTMGMPRMQMIEDDEFGDEEEEEDEVEDVPPQNDPTTSRGDRNAR